MSTCANCGKKIEPCGHGWTHEGGHHGCLITLKATPFPASDARLVTLAAEWVNEALDAAEPRLQRLYPNLAANHRQLAWEVMQAIAPVVAAQHLGSS